jgi:hypothetical protein
MTTPATKDHPQPHLFTVTVNRLPVSIAGPKTNGLAVKEAAIAQGVPIQRDFILSLELPNGNTRLVRDTDEVSLNENMKFVAVANDDNSDIGR